MSLDVCSGPLRAKAVTRRIRLRMEEKASFMVDRLDVDDIVFDLCFM